MSTASPRIVRARTAIARDRLSVPARAAVTDQVITADTSVLDYGCGRGDDVRHLTDMGVRAKGWDPHFLPDPPPTRADVVLLTYVLNVIEDLHERAATLRRALKFAKQCLIVSSRLRWDDVDGVEHHDGVVTGRGTFQALHRPRELRLWTQMVTGIAPLSAGPETVYLFTDVKARARHIHRTFMRSEHHVSGAPVLQRLAMHLSHHGRPLRPYENPELAAELAGTYGSLDRAHRAAHQIVPSGAVAAAARRRTADIIVSLAMNTFHGRPRLTDLPPSAKADILAFFGSYAKACQTAEQLLVAVGDPEVIRRSMKSARTGKLTPTSLYIHIDAVHHLPALLRVYDACARLVAGLPTGTTILRLFHTEPAVAYLRYPTFDTDPHPELHSGMVVSLSKLSTKWLDHSTDPDPPILHRREEFVSADHPKRSQWVKATAEEVVAGLFDDPATIATRVGWRAAKRRRTDRSYGGETASRATR